LGAEVIEIHVKPNGLNINEKCGATDLTSLQENIKTHQAHLGIAFDGDGDRVMMVDAQGEIVDGDELLFITVKHAYEQGSFSGGVVGTLMTNYGVECALQKLAIPFVRAKVGDRYVLEELIKRNWYFGGESSGHIICLHKTSTGAGIISALQVLVAMIESGKTLHALKQEMQKLPQVMVNVRVDKKCLTNPAITAAVTAAEQQLQGNGRILLRASGTEPLVRVMVEGKEFSVINKIANELANLVRISATEV
jgi:phosphoglucosamine mutase